MSAFFSPPVDVAPAMYVGDECRECAHSATKSLGMALRENSWPHGVDNNAPRTSTKRIDNLEACSLHRLLNAVDAAGKSANVVLLRLTPDERARLCTMGARLPGEHATSPAKRARLA